MGKDDVLYLNLGGNLKEYGSNINSKHQPTW